MRFYYLIICFAFATTIQANGQQCTGTPNSGIAAAADYAVCFGVTNVLTVSGLTTDSGVVYQWEANNTSLGAWVNLPAGGIVAAAGSFNDTSVTIAGQTEPTQYRLVSTCLNSGLITYTTTITVAIEAPINCYCTPSFTVGNASGSYINSVQLEDIDTVSGANAAVPDYWVSYTNNVNQTTVLDLGSTYTLNVEVGTNPTDNTVAAWMDYNSDGDFNDAGEKLGEVTGLVGGSVANVSFTVPGTSSLGLHLLRIREVTGNIGVVACATYPLGETEDYAVTLMNVPASCTAIPVAGTISPSSVNVIGGDTFTLEAIGYSVSPDFEYQWQVGLISAGGPFTNIAGATNSILHDTATVWAATRYYRFCVTCLTNGDQDCATSVVTTTVPPCTGMPVAGVVSGPAFVLPGDSFMLSATGYTNATGIVFQWQYDNGGAWINSPGDTSASAWFSQTVSAQYRLIVTCINSGATASSNPFFVGLLGGACDPVYTYAQSDTSYEVQFTPVVQGSGTYLWTFDWIDSATVQTPVYDFLDEGFYDVCLYYNDTVNGCLDSFCNTVYVSPLLPPTVTIGGMVYMDQNQNGVMDGWESGISNQAVVINGGTLFTDWFGYYETYLPTDTYTISYDVPLAYQPAWSNSGLNQLVVNAVLNGGYYTDNNFGVFIDSGYHNLSLVPTCFDPTPGFHKDAGYTLYNNGVNVESATLTINYDAQLELDSTWSDPATSINPIVHQAVYDLTLYPGWNYVYLAYFCPVGTPIGNVINIDASLLLTGFADADPSDNVANCQGLVVSSFDPNDKNVNPAGIGINHAIHPDSVSELTYTVRFQNTGTAPAVNVLIIDTLDNSKFDVSTLQMIHTSHAANIEIVEGIILQAHFNNIMLPDSFSNEPESHGQFTFKINLHQGLSNGNVISNSASIYFDFNAPVLTNSAFVTLDESLSNHSVPVMEAKLNVHPNPVSSVLYLKSTTRSAADFVVTNLVGQPLLNGTTDSNGFATVNISGLSEGVYILKVGATARKFIVMH